MLSTGIDIHKHSSVASTQDAAGVIVREARIVHADAQAFVRSGCDPCWGRDWGFTRPGVSLRSTLD